MARTVEVLGAPGVGKSTLVGAADGVRVTADAVIRDARAALRSRRLPGVLGALPPFRRWTRDPDPARRTEALARRAAEWEVFLRACADATPALAVDPLVRLARIDWLLRSLELAALAEEHPTDEWLLLDEGPAQRALGTPDPAAFAALVPAPTAVVLISGADPVVGPRLAGRAEAGTATLRHRRLGPAAALASSRDDAAVLATVTRVLGDRGVPVLQLDGATPVEALVRALSRWLATVGGPSRPPARLGT